MLSRKWRRGRSRYEQDPQDMRKPIAVFVLLAFMAFWIWLVAAVGAQTGTWPKWAELVFYVFAGIGWILPIRPLFAWMNRGTPPEED